jgi:hypothetical protein
MGSNRRKIRKDYKMKLKVLFSVLILIVLQIGCATTYQKDGFTGGFTEIQLSENVWRISFRGNAFTGSEKTQDFLMLRNAEITIEKGYKYFVIKTESTEIDTSIHTTPGHFNFVTNSQTGGTMNVYNKPRSQNIIILFKEKPQNLGILYDPEIIINSIKTKYHGDFQGK